ncbi:polar amino acid transport system permease protein [Paenarthrobacter nicotinovorans]|uniref:amino acid ABC transporter permease n=1 Tax=Micrococcaceae TaxID=1268 RepID=UPI000876CB0F|nr:MULTISPECIES: amino acid ABC transporter permease [Micrococcaceae]MDR6436561.1 polar amino acid transport system permease protein [Paenarthrobacter nicotinovorans]SCZ57318.1 polar amino acid transport system permease protein [Arthrobacter sp. UNCCL28]
MSLTTNEQGTTNTSPSPELIKAVPVRHPGRWVGAAIIVLVAAVGIQSLATNPNFHWDTFGLYVLDENVIRGVGWTLLLTVLSMALAVTLAILLAFMRQSENPIFRWSSWFWVWFFRGTPVYTQLIFWGLVAVLYPKITVGVPFGPELLSLTTQDLLNAFWAAVLGLALNESAYLAEIFRAGLKSVDKGQIEAAEALGMRGSKIMWRIVLPQAMRIIVPPTGNETIGMLKTTSLVLAVPFTLDLTFVTNTLANRSYLPIPLLIVAAFWYLVVTSVLMVGQHFIEKHYGKGVDVSTRISVNTAAFQAAGAGVNPTLTTTPKAATNKEENVR